MNFLLTYPLVHRFASIPVKALRWSGTSAAWPELPLHHDDVGVYAARGVAPDYEIQNCLPGDAVFANDVQVLEE